MFQHDRFEIGDEPFFEEFGGRSKVRIEEKNRRAAILEFKLLVIAVERKPSNGVRPHNVNELLVVSETEGAGLNAGWTLSEL